MRIIPLLLLSALLTYCGSPRSTTGGKIPSTRTGRTGGGSNQTDFIIVTGTEFLTVSGRNEAGVRPDLEGSWLLQSMPGADNSGQNILSQRNPNEDRRDTVVTKNSDGSTTTTVYIIDKDGNRGNRITPPQSSNPNMHSPEKPKLQFFGSNETYSGFTGCNKISGRYTLTGRNSLVFKNVNPSFKMACIGDYDETPFITTLRKVNAYKTTSNELHLMEGEKVLLIFSRK